MTLTRRSTPVHLEIHQLQCPHGNQGLQGPQCSPVAQSAGRPPLLSNENWRCSRPSPVALMEIAGTCLPHAPELAIHCTEILFSVVKSDWDEIGDRKKWWGHVL